MFSPEILNRELGKSEVIFHQLNINVVLLVELANKLNIETAKISAQLIFKKYPLSQCKIISKDNNLQFSCNIEYFSFQQVQGNIDEILERETQFIFYDGEPLCRITYVESKESYFMIFCFSHTISDGYSALLFVYDFFNFYEASNKEKNFPISQLPKPIEYYISVETKIDESMSQDTADKTSQKFIFSTIELKKSLSHLGKKHSVISSTASIAAIYLQAFMDSLKSQKANLYLTYNLRTIVKELPNENVIFYSVGIWQQYNNISANDLAKLINSNILKIFSDKQHLMKSLEHEFNYINDLHFSFINDPIIKKMEKISLIKDLRFTGNACQKEKNKTQLFILAIQFRKSLNITLCYNQEFIKKSLCEKILLQAKEEIESLLYC